MSPIIKAGTVPAAAEIRAFALPRKLATANGRGYEQLRDIARDITSNERAASSPDVGRAQTDTLQENLQLAKALEDARAETDTLCAEAFREGREAGALEASSQGKELLQRVSCGVAEALDRFTITMGELENLAALLAHTGLVKIFGEHNDMSDLVAKAISKSVSQLRDAAILSVAVSKSDFADISNRDMLPAVLQGETVQLCHDADLASGECLIALHIGTLDIGPHLQMEKFRTLLLELAHAS